MSDGRPDAEPMLVERARTDDGRLILYYSWPGEQLGDELADERGEQLADERGEQLADEPREQLGIDQTSTPPLGSPKGSSDSRPRAGDPPHGLAPDV